MVDISDLHLIEMLFNNDTKLQTHAYIHTGFAVQFNISILIFISYVTAADYTAVALIGQSHRHFLATTLYNTKVFTS